MKLFSLFADLVLDTGQFNKGVGEATKQGKNMASSLSSGFTMISAKAVAIGHAMYDIGKQTAKAAVDFTKQIINEYAETEQLIGGVQAIFGESANSVLKNADNAFKTAGMSANEYMQTVTSFSSSLLQSLKGNTAEATRYADMAITDMSDNANRFGTDIGMIQNAYQGFAKQNYTMLDNLKLGYGGTQKEMQRLLKDAQKIKRANGENVRYNINNLADVYEAIHVIQTEMGVTGTTAAEASETIAGSFNAFKATWKNLLSGMPKDNADIDILLENMYDAGKTVLKNIYNVLPTIGQHAKAAFKFVTDKAKEAAPILYQTFKDTWDNKLPAIVQDGANGIIGIINSLLGTNIPKITSIDFPTWDEVKSGFDEWWSETKGDIEAAASWVLGIFTEPTATAEEAKATVSVWWTDTAKPAVEQACTWILGLFAPPSEAESDVKSTISEWWSTAGIWVSNACSWVLQMAGAPTENAEQVAAIVGIWWGEVKDSASAVCEIIYHLGKGDLLAAKHVIDEFWDEVQKAVYDTVTLVFKLKPPSLQEVYKEINSWWGGIAGLFPFIQTGKTSDKIEDAFKKHDSVLVDEESGESTNWWKETLNTFIKETKPYSPFVGIAEKINEESNQKESNDNEALSSSIESLNNTVATLPDVAASAAVSAAVSALSGAKIEMDGATVGSIVLKYVSAGLSRANRVAYKALSAD